MMRVMVQKGADGSASTGASNLGWDGQRFGLTGQAGGGGLLG